ncbi:MAG: TIGR03960 family B12-binding radical SAM protein [Deltaproteobacteria bacterium]|nr:TIGR03960 family B12-binding radical SAM protein [Deltaproteobacteria bacterium]
MKSVELKDYLPLVRKPSRYTGGEINAVRKDRTTTRLTIALAFPDTYEIGISHLGLQILYQILNGDSRIACERVYAPWVDMEALMREKGFPLTTLESATPLNECDVIGFSLQYELTYTNALAMLDLGGVPLRAADRSEVDPLVIGGGPCTFNPEPVADFFDAFLVGDGEEAVIEMAEVVMEAKEGRIARRELLRRLARIEGIYVPSLFDITYNDDGTVQCITPLEEGYERVKRRVVADLNKVPPTTSPVVPFVQAVHDRLGIEIARGCTRGCRFCQAGMITRPGRERDPDEVIRLIEESLRNTGYDEVSLLSLSTGDYSCIEPLLIGLVQRVAERRIAVSFPSMRVGTVTPRMAEEIRKVRKTGFTLAPEAGTERLRSVINKGISEAELIDNVRHIFSLGWKLIKLYFMMGLPTERDEDISGIVTLAEEVKRTGKAQGVNPKINVSVSTFIPKPNTPFQWAPQLKIDKCRERQTMLREGLRKRRLDFKWQDVNMSLLEGLFSRGDRRLAPLIERAFKRGLRFDAWGEQFRIDVWRELFEEERIDLGFYLYRERGGEEIFPWDHIDGGVTKEFLWSEYKRALYSADGGNLKCMETPDCKVEECSGCGVCDFDKRQNITFYDKEMDETALPPPSLPIPASPAGIPPVRIQTAFSKRGNMRFVSHLETATLFYRAVRRAELPISCSKGFHPHPQIIFSAPLPVGVESIAEYVELKLDEPVAPDQVVERLNAVMPDGINIMWGKELPLHLPALSAIIKQTEYIISVDKAPAGLDIDITTLDRRIRELLAKESFLISQKREKGNREVDIRPLIEDISYDRALSSLLLILNKRDGRSAKPHEIIAPLLDISAREASLIPILKTKTTT